MEDSIPEILARYEGKGFTSQFSARADGLLHCHACDTDEPAAQAPLEALHRLEGSSDPSEEAVVAALECPACGQHGTIVMSYGPEASAEDMAVLQELMDDRAHATITPGL